MATSNSRYAKYTVNSFKESYTRRHSIDQFSSNGGNRFIKKSTDDHSIQFIKPLKTSTVVCLAELNNVESNELKEPSNSHHVDNSSKMKKLDNENKSKTNDDKSRRHSYNFSAAFKSKGGIFSAFTQQTSEVECKKTEKDLDKIQQTTANELTEILDQIRYHIPGKPLYN